MLDSVVDKEIVQKNIVPEGIVGAVCVIRHDDKIVMLSEVITKKLSLPGGYIDPENTAKEAAVREALEETGLVVSIDKLLQYRGRAAIYSCVTDTPILVSSRDDHRNYTVVASWFAEHFGKEVKRVYLIDPDNVSSDEYRYPDDTNLLAKWIKNTPNSEITVYSDLSDKVNALHRFELTLMNDFQQWVKSQSNIIKSLFDVTMTVVNLPGEAYFLLFVTIVVIALYGPMALLQLLVILVGVIFISSLLKNGVASPRPFYIVPELQQTNAYGFSFPSGHTLMATVLWGMLWCFVREKNSIAKRPKSISLFTLFIVLMIIGQAIARVWYGVHYMSDTIASIILGIVIVILWRKWRHSNEIPLKDSIASKWFWLGTMILVGVIASVTQLPDHVYLFSALLAIFLSIEFVPKYSITLSVFNRFVTALITLIGIVVIGYFVSSLAHRSTVSLIVVVINSIGSVVTIGWAVIVPSVLYKKLAKE
ncbi:hypothetical protein P3TCK_17354 [Photobacterium profundum 3TCK]|uniref:undecaprenyl-diphosphate phosphatase n=1 Tax=Photobacterium profundum 3TCK TaxID=314280 RepID=Q1YWM3_9GAMM|nr:hypothetical protein P3TCK_17354 [Photobacterium profundum 3TCK]